ncbi:HPP family protein [Thermithiobacillus plumbiphilus]|uniref:HPP family protein n=1 Tax=Thermithiobacillus plumbiphilus TaxID=1729899 RepID=A0ABU9D4I4_9PROT
MEKKSLRPVPGAERAGRKRLSLKSELILALLPTIAVLLVFFLVESFSQQRLLFASLASSAFLIYLDPQHETNQVGTLFWAQSLAAVVGVLSLSLIGPGYAAAAVAMIVVIMLMVPLNVVHPPAVSTTLSFAFRSGDGNNLVLFGMALGMILVLVILEQLTLRLLAHLSFRHSDPENNKNAP